MPERISDERLAELMTSYEGWADISAPSHIQHKGREMRAMLAELQALRREREWRPIETCPRSPVAPVAASERIHILLWNGRRQVIGYLDPDDGDGYGDQFVAAETGEAIEPRAFGSSEPAPTHWLPLPEPPYA